MEAHHRVIKASSLSIFPEVLPCLCPLYQIKDPVGQTKGALQDPVQAELSQQALGEVGNPQY